MRCPLGWLPHREGAQLGGLGADMSDFRGARGSNTGDDFHELWAARHAIRLLDERDPLQAIAVEGVAPSDGVGTPDSTWDGVDCALYEGGEDAIEADQVLLEQLKYSAANPKSKWTIARITQSSSGEESVLRRLAKAWIEMSAQRGRPGLEVSLITNQPISEKLESVTANVAKGGVSVPRARPGKSDPEEAKFAFAARLAKNKLPEFAASLHFNGGAGSRYAIEGRLLSDVAGWTDLELQTTVAQLRQFIRNRMRPEFAGELIKKEDILLGLGVSSAGSLFPCPAILEQIKEPVPRRSVAEVAGDIVAGKQRVCLHGPGGIGKTTALQQIEAALPPHSIMISFDCYGGGTYMDSAALRHRPIDAFLQLTNELATKLRLPILLGRHQQSDPVRLFWNRLQHAAGAISAEYPDALIVIAVDAADNAIAAAAARRPPEPCFVHDFVALGDPPENVRFVMTARTGRLRDLELPSSYQLSEIPPFTVEETAVHVGRIWTAPPDWLGAFHHLTQGVPRVQAYALDLGVEPPEHAIERLLPGGRSLDQVFREQLKRALAKSGNPADVAKVCAGLISLARPVPLADLSVVLDISVPSLIDICSDMAPAIRLNEDRVSFADEDFEHFVREEGGAKLEEVTGKAADWLLARSKEDAYAAQHVAGALAAAGRGGDLLDLVENEPSPSAIADPVERREAELSRLRLAISFCRGANDVARAMRFVLIGAEGLKAERALRVLLSESPDLAVRFAPDSAARLILTDPSQIGFHGAFLLHRQVVSAIAGDYASIRQDARLLQAWMSLHQKNGTNQNRTRWRLDVHDAAASVEVVLRTEGAAEALRKLSTWQPMSSWRRIACTLIPRLLAQEDEHLLWAVLDAGMLKAVDELVLLVPMALAGHTIDPERIKVAVVQLLRRVKFQKLDNGSSPVHGTWSWTEDMDTAMTACELLASHSESAAVVEGFLSTVLDPANRQMSSLSTAAPERLDLLFRAHALRTALAGSAASSEGFFVARPSASDETRGQRQISYSEQDADRKLMELADIFLPVYTATADAMAGRISMAATEGSLATAVARRVSNSWRISRDYNARVLAGLAARRILVLVTRGFRPELIAETARKIHGTNEASSAASGMDLAERMAICPALHASLMKEVAEIVPQIRSMRIGSEEKAKALLGYSRLVLPISQDDANSIFHDAVSAAAELDREVVAQLHLVTEMLQHGLDKIEQATEVSRNLSEVISDAAIRLDGSAVLPWQQVMKVLTAINLPLALANAGKWDSGDLVGLHETLPHVLTAGVAQGELKPGAAMALDMLLKDDHNVAEASLDQIDDIHDRNLYMEEAAWDALIRRDKDDVKALCDRAASFGAAGTWSKSLAERQAFLSKLPSAPTDEYRSIGCKTEAKIDWKFPPWKRDALIDSNKFDETLAEAVVNAKSGNDYVSLSVVLAAAARGVSFRDRVAFLNALSNTRSVPGGEVVETLSELVEQWSSPAVRTWATSVLPEVIVARLPDFIRYIEFEVSALPKALELSGLAPAATADLLLRGLELHGQSLDGGQVFALAGLVARFLSPEAAAETGAWYAERLGKRIELQCRDQTWLPAELPPSAAAAVARLIYSRLGDHDVRVRWQAAHSVRRLARLGQTDELKALIEEYGRREERLFRPAKLDFYWIASQLWFAIAWDRVASESPRLGALVGSRLLAIALDRTFPHLLVTSFARDACLKLVDAGVISLDQATVLQLQSVGRSGFEPGPSIDRRWRLGGGGSKDIEHRFRFDHLDTVPYWYEPVARCFAALSVDQLLTAAESWIIDRWGYPAEVTAHVEQTRGSRISENDWSLASNRHGSKPTLERLRTHLEWHGLWCAVGELLLTEKLVASGDSHWENLRRRVADEMLTEPPLWCSDLLRSKPLKSEFWRISREPLADWVDQVNESRMRSELIPVDRPGYIAVGGEWRIRNFDRLETVSLSSALVEPRLAASLLRTLQSMSSSWDYSVPTEGEDDSLYGDESEYRMIPWLRSRSSDGGVDHHDPYRGSAGLIDWVPGRRVVDKCGLIRDPTVRTAWCSPGQAPMFQYEVWGDDQEEDRGVVGAVVSGRRLLVETEQLKRFLIFQGLDLFIEVEVSREGRSSRRSFDSEGTTPGAAYDRVYSLDGEGRLHAAEGCVGTWASDST